MEPSFPKKRFGQHFLFDKNILKKIVATAGVEEGDNVLEIGPGRGALTEALLDAGASVLAIEVDRDLIAFLKERFSGVKGFEVIEADALKVSFAELSRGRGARFKAVSNLPYNISGPILSKFIAERGAFSSMVLMFQREVAGRIAARPGTREYGSLSVLAQTYADIRIEFPVPPHLFTPRPKVSSAVVSFRFLEGPRVRVSDEAFYRAVVRAAFSTRRKTLLNSLKGVAPGKEDVREALANAGIDGGRRGETLTLQEFSALTEALLSVRERA